MYAYLKTTHKEFKIGYHVYLRVDLKRRSLKLGSCCHMPNTLIFPWDMGDWNFLFYSFLSCWLFFIFYRGYTMALFLYPSTKSFIVQFILCLKFFTITTYIPVGLICLDIDFEHLEIWSVVLFSHPQYFTFPWNHFTPGFLAPQTMGSLSLPESWLPGYSRVTTPWLYQSPDSSALLKSEIPNSTFTWAHHPTMWYNHVLCDWPLVSLSCYHMSWPSSGLSVSPSLNSWVS